MQTGKTGREFIREFSVLLLQIFSSSFLVLFLGRFHLPLLVFIHAQALHLKVSKCSSTIPNSCIARASMQVVYICCVVKHHCPSGV